MGNRNTGLNSCARSATLLVVLIWWIQLIHHGRTTTTTAAAAAAAAADVVYGWKKNNADVKVQFEWEEASS